jgi:hypothetical protein
MWHGGYAWGPRFMIPTLPFWSLFLTPVIAQIFGDWRIRKSDLKLQMLRTAFFGLGLLSFIPQLLSVLIDFAPFQNALLETGLPLFDRRTFFEPQYSPFARAWAFIKPETLDFAWAWQGRLNGWLLAILCANIIITGWSLKRIWGAGEIGNYQLPIPNYQFLITNFRPYLSTLITAIFLLTYTHTLPSEPLQEAVAALNEAVKPADAVVTNDPEIAMPFAELYKGRASVLGLNSGGLPLAEDTAQRLQQTVSNHRQVWWVPNWLPPEESGIEQTLLAEGFRVRSQEFAGQRLVLFAYPDNLWVVNDLNEANFNNSIHLMKVAYPSPVTGGAAFPVELYWQTTAPLAEDYHVFIHLLDAQGQLVTQADGQPAQWRRPTSTWQIGETIVDRHGLWIPAEINEGNYQLLVGLYRPTDGQRLYLLTGADAVRLEIPIS